MELHQGPLDWVQSPAKEKDLKPIKTTRRRVAKKALIVKWKKLLEISKNGKVMVHIAY